MNNLTRHKILWFAIIFTPTFSHILGTHTGQLVYTILVVFLEISLIIVSKLNISYLIIKPIFISMYFTFYFACVTLFNYQNLLSISDIIDILRPLLYLLFFLFPLVVQINEKDFKKLFLFIVKLILVASLLDFFSFFHPLEFLLGLYRPSHYGDFNYFRFSGTFGYAYNYAFILIFFIIYYIKTNASFFTVNSFILFLLVVYSILTGSRTSIASLILIILLFYILQNYNIISICFKIAKLTFFILVTLLILNYLEFHFFEKIFDYIFRLILFSQGESADGAASTRINQLTNGLLYLTPSNMLFGIGPSKTLLPIMESMYPTYLVKWGVIGIFSYFSLLFSLYYSSKVKQGFVKDIMISYRGLIIVIFIFGFSTSPTDQVKLYNFFYLLSGYVYLFKINYLNTVQGNKV